MLTLDRSTARRLILHLQGLSDPHHRARGPRGQIELVHRLGYVQVDSIQWTERAHHVVLAAREQAYRPRHLTRMAERERSVFEGWTHDACYIPSAFYPLWRHRHRRVAPGLDRRFGNWQGSGFRDHTERLTERIRETGPLRARDLEKAPGVKPMWQWDDGKAALEYLWRTGTLAIARRDGFQKVYDLAERVLPSAAFDARVTEEAFIDWANRTALDRLGIATPAQIARYFDLVSIAETKSWLEQQGGQSIRPVLVDGREMVARPDIEDVVANLSDPPSRTRVLSPFDPILRDRDRASWLWNFDYRIEIYVPEAKRIWGYYIHPLLDGERIAGRIDIKANRRERTLDVARHWWEPGIRPSKARMARLEAEMERQRRLTGMDAVRWLPGSRQPSERPLSKQT